LAALLAIGLAGLFASGCGGGDDDGADRPSGHRADAVFVTELLANHQAGVEMADAARRRGEHSEIRRLAVAMVETGRTEMTDLQAARRKLARARIDVRSPSAQRKTGGGAPAIPSGAGPFDLVFVDAMIAHGERAIDLARGQLNQGSHARLRAMARDILTAHRREVAHLRRLRARWYGNAEPPERKAPGVAGSGARRSWQQGRRSAEIRGPRRRARDHSRDVRRYAGPAS